MKISTLSLAIAIMLTSGLPIKAADNSTVSDREELREKLKKLTPEERAAKMKEWKEKNPDKAGQMEKRRAELEKLTPEERAAKMKELREKGAKSATGGKTREEWQKVSPEERQAKMKEWRNKMEGGLATLRKKKADGTITEEENRKLTRMEETLKRMETQRNASTAQPEKTAKE